MKRGLGTISALAALVLGCADVTLASADAQPLLQGAEAPRRQLRQEAVLARGGVVFRRFRQHVGGVPVLGGEVVVTEGSGAKADLVLDDTFRDVRVPVVPSVPRAGALEAAMDRVGVAALRADARAALAILPGSGRNRLVWRVLLPSLDPLASFEVLVDARTGDVVRVRDILRRATGTASLFDPNPVERQESRSGLSDSMDSDSPLLASLRTPVSLVRLLDSSPCTEGPFTLRGDWALATLSTTEACPGTLDFTGVQRQDDRFEALMAYFHIDRVQAYLRSLGFTNVVDRQQVILANVNLPNDPDMDNSFFDPATGEIGLGTGGTDDGEDADVMVHEYGHAIQYDQVPGFSASGETGAMGEGFSDYLAATMSAAFTPGAFDPCIGEWDAFGFPMQPECIRRTDGDPTVAQVMGFPCFGEIHCAGEAWSSALWDIRAQLGGMATDRLVIQSHFSLTPSADFHAGSRALLAADAALNGAANQAFIRNLLIARGLLDPERLDDTPAEAVPLAIPGQVSGSLSSADLHDVYRLSLVAGAGVQVNLSGSGDFDLRLYAPGTTSLNGGGAVASSTTPGGSSESLAYLASSAGDFYLDVAVGSGAGSYTLIVAKLDSDRDGHADEVDNCAAASNPGQEDLDRDRIGDVCDRFPQDAANDVDGDGFGANVDNCPTASNPGQEDLDRDGIGDVCDRFPQDRANDADRDGRGANVDNCPRARNANQADWDRDGKGDRCDRDALVRLTRILVRGSLVLLRGELRPRDFALGRVRALVQRQVCEEGRCRYRRVTTAKGATRTGPGRLVLDLRLRREGLYRVRLELADPRYERAKSAFRAASIRR